MDFRINETLQTGAVRNRTYRVGVNAAGGNRTYRVGVNAAGGNRTEGESVYLFLEFTIIFSHHNNWYSEKG